MGYKFYVLSWVMEEQGKYANLEVYGGQSFIKALLAMRKAKKNSGCVRLEWR